MAFGLTGRFSPFLSELVDLLPGEFHGHYQKSNEPIFEKNYQIKRQGTFWKMKLSGKDKFRVVKEIGSDSVIRLNDSHTIELTEFYKSAYPDGFFDKRELSSGKYFGKIIDGKIVSVAGVHVDSEEHGVTVFGSIATLPEFRGNRYATVVTARLLKEVVNQRQVIMLNVDSKNHAAVKCYSNLGFKKSHEYEEGFFSLK
jgi:ribosomal protein S18 acetylase RimI-like enzyme